MSKAKKETSKSRRQAGPEDGGDIFIRNVEIPPNYIALEPTVLFINTPFL
jgi:hypothetical protein